MTSRTEFDYAAWEAWLTTLTPERVAELRAGMALAYYFDTEYAKMREEIKEPGNE